MDQIRSAVNNVARRCRWQRGWSGAWTGFLLGAAVALVSLLAHKLFPVSFTVSLFGLLAMPLGSG